MIEHRIILAFYHFGRVRCFAKKTYPRAVWALYFVTGSRGFFRRSIPGEVTSVLSWGYHVNLYLSAFGSILYLYPLLLFRYKRGVKVFFRGRKT